MNDIEAIYKVIGKNIRRQRKQQKISQDAIAAFTGYRRPSSINDIEQGRVRIPVHILATIATLLNVSIQELLEEQPLTIK